MNPQSAESAGIKLPPPVETTPSITSGGAVDASEKAPVGAEKAPMPGAVAPIAHMPAPPILQTTLPQDLPTPAPALPQADNQVPIITDDGDLIEKEWVLKAKQIVERNRDNPYKQSEELTVVKADYMKQRYGKTIKTSQ